MRRRQQVIASESAPPQSLAARFFTVVGGLILAGLSLLGSMLVIIAIAWVLETLFPKQKTVRISHAGGPPASVPQDVRAYLNAVGKQVSNSATDLGAVTQLSADAAAKPALVHTPDWQRKVAAACSALDADGKALESIAPVPADCAAMNVDARRAGQRYVEIATDFSEGTDTRHLSTDAVLRAGRATHLVLEQDDKALVADSNAIRAKY